MSKLYPIKFAPIYKNKVWGGSRLRTVLGKSIDGENVGESWELSGVDGSVSVVVNGFLAGNDLDDILEIYMGDILGERVFEKFGNTFPLLLKFIDANDVLSVQVHPDDDLALEKYNSFGKTEMWYVIDATPDAYVYSGFAKQINKPTLRTHIETNAVAEILNKEIAHKGDVFFVPAGRIHATGPGVLFAEVQQSSDITYRVYDWNRKGSDGKPRDLHVNDALEAIDFEQPTDFRTTYKSTPNLPIEIGDCPYFVVNKLILTAEYYGEYHVLDSFVVYMCLEGSATIEYNNSESETITKGETVLIPAVLEFIKIVPEEEISLLEIYIPNKS